MKLYEKIKSLLESSSEYRNSDRKLIWRVWEDENKVNAGYEYDAISYDCFMNVTSPESIRRARQLVQADFPELQSDKRILKAKELKESSKGTFAYREEFTGKLFN